MLQSETAAPYSAAPSAYTYTQDEQKTINAAKEILLRRLRTTPHLTNSDASRDYLQLLLAAEPVENFVVVHLDAKHQVMAVQTLCTGTIDTASIYPREVIRAVMQYNSAAAVFAHNHPSGNPEPSQADVTITRKLKTALETIGVRVLDHIVVGVSGTVSFAERGLL
jgi:DNA repair protein RadC